MADAFFVPFFSSLSFNTHGSKLIGLIVNCSSVATGTRAGLFGTHISAHGLPPPLALISRS
uniref:Uncharacterized protein n=1 Tax=Cannabis sativa TaxID=3483 RepID=A0A803QV30_CANSA